MSYRPIESYGIIGDLHTTALVGLDGSIDFMCFPKFDSPSVFAALLDNRRGGRFRIAPVLEEVRHKQLYLPETNVLITRFLSHEGVAEIVDFMPVEEVGHAHNIVRRVKTIRGTIRYAMTCDPRFDYGRARRTTHAAEDGVTFASQGSDGIRLRLRTRVPISVRDGAAHAEFTLAAGESMDFILDDELGRASVSTEFVDECLEHTVDFWRRWIGQCTYQGRWREMVNRSALAMKLLFSEEHGSLVAAPTFGLPEQLGGERNWDYRYTWIRDSAFTVHALLRLGFRGEARAFSRWIGERCSNLVDGSRPPLQIMYGLDGRRDLVETVLDHFEGYKGSHPVRIGNGAANQLQLDIYGELLDAIHLHDQFDEPIRHDMWLDVERLVEYVCANWQVPDEGIWEVRGGRREFLYSRLQCWVAIDRAMRIAAHRSLPAPIDRWRAARDAIYRDIHTNFFDEQLGAFVQHQGSRALDASSLLMPMANFISFTDPRWLSHLDAIGDRLVEDSLVYRYRVERGASDGLAGDEGTFTMCSFWYVENLARAGRLNQARFCFEKMLGYANHLGLYSEELGANGEHLGNYPQAFTHLGLISAALSLDSALSRAGYQA
jgi:GH15 family glucan-1,4-alpha-glucosidase